MGHSLPPAKQRPRWYGWLVLQCFARQFTGFTPLGQLGQPRLRFGPVSDIVAPVPDTI